MGLKIASPEMLDSKYAEARKSFRILRDARSALINKFASARNRYDTAEEDRIRKELRKVDADADMAEGAFVGAKATARQAATERLLADPAYLATVNKAVEALDERLSPWLSLNQIVVEAGAAGVILPVMPPSIVAEIKESASWIRLLLRKGVIDVAALPPALKALIGGDDA
jgi:hypothetical protein